MKKKLSFKKRIKMCFTILIKGLLPVWWWNDLSDEFYDDKVAHDYKDGKFDYRGIHAWFINHSSKKINFPIVIPNTKISNLKGKLTKQTSEEIDTCVGELRDEWDRPKTYSE